jgi:hypothetical protein
MQPLGAILGERDVCDHAGAVLHRCIGNNAIGLWCDRCKTWTTKKEYGVQWLPRGHAALANVDVEHLPEIGLRIYRRCQGPCGQLAQCEEHHVAPKAFFGDEAAQWPTLWFCRHCHDRWHSTLTPGLCTAYDADHHAQQLLDYLGLEKAKDLTNALISLWKARRKGAA